MGQSPSQELHERLVDLLASGEAAAAAERILREPEQLASIASRSYTHPNGFRKLVIAAPEDGSRLRLHHWPAGDVRPSNVHNHRWPLASAVITGRLCSEFLAMAETGEPIERYLFHSSRPGGRYAMSPNGTGRIRVMSVAAFGPGTTYALEAKQLHRVHAGRGTLTLVLSGPAEQETADVFRPAALGAQSRDLPLLAGDTVRESLALLVENLRSWEP